METDNLDVIIGTEALFAYVSNRTVGVIAGLSSVFLEIVSWLYFLTSKRI